MTSIYLAGKISKNDWRPYHRSDYYPGASDFPGDYGLPDWADIDVTIEGLHVTGPFFVSCDHGCAHNNGSHASVNSCPCFGQDGLEMRSKTWQRCMDAIKRADIFFAWLDDDTTAHGTLVEIGYAKALGKPIIVGSPRRLDDEHKAEAERYRVYDDADDDPDYPDVGKSPLDDMWFAVQCADSVFVAPTPSEALRGIAALVRAVAR